MKVTFYYNDGITELATGSEEFVNQKIKAFSENPRCSFWVSGDSTHQWNTEKKHWEPMAEVPFRLFWLDGKTEVIYGTSIATAFNKKYGGGAINVLDRYDTKEEQTHDWNSEQRRWIPRKPAFDPS